VEKKSIELLQVPYVNAVHLVHIPSLYIGFEGGEGLPVELRCVAGIGRKMRRLASRMKVPCGERGQIVPAGAMSSAVHLVQIPCLYVPLKPELDLD
jgi:hypothetical protein